MEQHPALTYLALSTAWITLLYALLGLIAGEFSMLLVAPFFGLTGGAYIAAWQVGPLARVDWWIVERAQRDELPDWIAWCRFLFVLMPYAIYGWVPRKVQNAL